MKQQGTVKWFRDDKGYGFIVPDTPRPDGRDLFVHQTAIKMDGFRTLVEGQRVEFEVEKRDGKDQAQNVIRLDT